MKHFLFSITIALFSMTTVCMEISEQRIPIKLADATISIPFSLVHQSAVLCKKQHWKKRLNIPCQKPIVVPHITSQQMALFAKAVSVSEDDFPSFYKQLSQTEQAELLHISHENNLDSPYLTILLAQTVLPQDITTGLICPKTVDLEKITRYCRMVALKNNIQNKKTTHYSTLTYNLFCGHTGILKKLPSEEPLHNLDMAYNVSCSDTQALTIKNYNNLTIQAIVSCKRINNFFYIITRTRTKSNIWQIRECPDNFWKLTYSENTRVKKYDKRFKVAIFSPNGKFIFYLTEDPTENSSLLKLSNKKEEFITEEVSLPDSFSKAALPQFNSSSTAFFLRSWQEAPLTSRVILYNIETNKYKIISVSIPHFIINQQWSPDGNKLAVLQSDCDSLSQITIYDTTNLDIYNTIQLASFITDITYTNNKDLVAVTKEGSLYIISENDDHSYSTELIKSPLGNNIIDSSLIFFPTRNILCAFGENMLLWDLETKTFVGKIDSSTDSTIIKNKEESYFLTQNSISWDKHILWSPEDSTAIEWIKKCPTLYKTYALHRLYKAHKKNTSLPVREQDPIFHVIIESFPDDVQLSLKEHLFKHPSLTKNILEKGKDLYASLVSLFS